MNTMRRWRVSAQIVAVALLAGLAAACGPQNNRNEKAVHEGGSEKFAHEGGRGHGHGLRAACADEIQKFCANEDRKKRCLRENSDKLSEGCKTALAQRGHKHGDNGNNANNTNNTNNKNTNSDDDDN